MTTAATAEVQHPITANDDRDVPLPLRGDTFLGVCEAVGQDLGFNPNWLRIPFAALLLWNPAVILAAYFGLGGVVALSRWLFPAGKTEAQAAVSSAAAKTGKNADAAARDSEEERLAA